MIVINLTGFDKITLLLKIMRCVPEDRVIARGHLTGYVSEIGTHSYAHNTSSCKNIIEN